LECHTQTLGDLGPVMRLNPNRVASRWVPKCVKDCPEMVVIPPGEFWMGSADGEGDKDGSELPRHRIKIDEPIAVGKFEVTWDEWEACSRCVGAMGSQPATVAMERGATAVDYCVMG